MNKKRIIIIAIIIIVIMIIALFFMWPEKDETVVPAVVNTNTADILPSDGEETADQPPVTVVTEKDRDQTELKNRVKFFVAMLGSYSSDAQFQNIIDLKPMMTNSMRAWADGLVARNLSNLENQNEQITTQVFKTEVLSYTGSWARVKAFTRREEEEKIYNQEAEVELVKTGGEWLINSVEWK